MFSHKNIIISLNQSGEFIARVRNITIIKPSLAEAKENIEKALTGGTPFKPFDSVRVKHNCPKELSGQDMLEVIHITGTIVREQPSGRHKARFVDAAGNTYTKALLNTRENRLLLIAYEENKRAWEKAQAEQRKIERKFEDLLHYYNPDEYALQ